MVTKISFEPKDARITFEIDTMIRKRKTGTQALVDFLNTTSPEEFQKKSLIFRRKKSNSIITTTTTKTNKKNHIEIVANPLKFNKTKFDYDIPYYRKPPSLLMETLHVPKHRSIPLPVQTEHDLIEEGLKKRLELCKKPPSDVVAQALSKAHTEALSHVPIVYSKQTRHMQVQTLPFVEPLLETEKEEEEEGQQTLRQLKQQLRKEKLINARLEASLKETRDHYEVLTGLAYQKLQAIMEEKNRWEMACMEVKEHCWQEHHHIILD